MKNLLFLVIATALCDIHVSCGAKILAVVPVPTKSHHNLLDKLAVDLVNKGHQVTLITAFPREKPLNGLEEIIYPNYYDELIESFLAKSGNSVSGMFDWQPNSVISMILFHEFGLKTSESFLSAPVIKELVSSARKFDAIIGEAFINEAILAGFAKKFDAPLIGVATGFPTYYSSYLVGNPSPTAYVPSPILGYTNEMTFSERLTNFLFETFSSVYFHVVYLPKQDQIMRKHFGHELPYVEDVMTNTSLVLVNHHHSLAFPRPYLPNMVEVGGYHVRPVKPLPNDIKKYLDEAKHGAILFTLGSHFKSKYVPKESVLAFLKAFAKLKQNVLWKFDDDGLSDIPKNVKVLKWLPQSDILAHPNLKLFITHGGMLSTIEAVARGVPLLGLPIFADQPTNMKFVEKAGCGKTLSFSNLTEKSLYDSITELIENPKYRENVKRRSTFLLDTPLPAADLALYWIEYVLRHKGAPFLRSGALDLKWYQLHLLDVMITIALTLLLGCWISYRFIKKIIKMIRRENAAETCRAKKRN